RAYLLRGPRVEQLTVDHTMAQELVRLGVLTPEEAEHSTWKNILIKFLGCTSMSDGADVRPFTPHAGDRLLLATDGLTNHIRSEEDLIEGPERYPDPEAWADTPIRCPLPRVQSWPRSPGPQDWADHLVTLALERGSSDNVTCVVVAFGEV